MMPPTPSITVSVDLSNPGHFFACCGILGLADRRFESALGWFDYNGQSFHVACQGALPELITSLVAAEFRPLDPDDPYSTGFTIGEPFRRLAVDWWNTDRTGAKDLKVWAGTMESFGIANAMRMALKAPEFHSSGILNIGRVVENPEKPGDKKEPYYFDARRSPNAHSRDIGFSPNDLRLTTTAHPAVEFFSVIGLQFSRPAPTSANRIYEYFPWPEPIPVSLIGAASCGLLPFQGCHRYRFENWFRTSQKKHKAFCFATRVSNGD